MVDLGLPIEAPPLSLATVSAIASEKKAGVAEHLKVFDHAGLLSDGPLGTAGLSFS